MNEEARALYHKECCDIIDILNQQIAPGQPKLRAPDPKFNRQIGTFSGKTYSVDGRLLSDSEYGEHLKSVLPQSEDLERLKGLAKDKDWLASTQPSVQ